MADSSSKTVVTVVSFDSSDAAENMLENLQAWEDEGYIKVKDAVVVRRQTGRKDVEVQQTVRRAGRWTLGGGGIGLLAGLLLGGPIGGLVAGATIGAIGGSMKDYGINDEKIKQISEGLPDNSSALFLMTEPVEGRNEDAFYAELAPYKANVISTTLDAESEARLRALLKDEG